MALVGQEGEGACGMSMQASQMLERSEHIIREQSMQASHMLERAWRARERSRRAVVRSDVPVLPASRARAALTCGALLELVA